MCGFNKREENKKIKTCEICDNLLHVKCSKNGLCTCQRNTEDNELMKKINNCIYINEKINKKFFKKTKLGLKKPKKIGKKFSIIDILNNIGLSFSNELVYNCDENLNYYLMEYRIFELHKDDAEIYYEVKEMTKEGKYNYLKITQNKEQGYIVKAKTFIEENTLICEYVGDVFTFKDFCNKQIDNDSNMDLILTPQSETSLVICPFKNSNIARFLSGVNNSSDVEKEINVFSAKVSINGIVHILLIAKKDIEENDILYYDYNADTNNYPTENFVYKKK